jgi:hypothetical protein
MFLDTIFLQGHCSFRSGANICYFLPLRKGHTILHHRSSEEGKLLNTSKFQASPSRMLKSLRIVRLLDRGLLLEPRFYIVRFELPALPTYS